MFGGYSETVNITGFKRALSEIRVRELNEANLEVNYVIDRVMGAIQSKGAYRKPLMEELKRLKEADARKPKNAQKIWKEVFKKVNKF